MRVVDGPERLRMRLSFVSNVQNCASRAPLPAQVEMSLRNARYDMRYDDDDDDDDYDDDDDDDDAGGGMQAKLV